MHIVLLLFIVLFFNKL